MRARVKPKPFRRRECEQPIHELVAFMNEAPSLSADAVTEWVDARDIEVDCDYPVSKNVGGVLYTFLFFQEFRMWGRKARSGTDSAQGNQSCQNGRQSGGLRVHRGQEAVLPCG